MRATIPCHGCSRSHHGGDGASHGAGTLGRGKVSFGYVRDKESKLFLAVLAYLRSLGDAPDGGSSAPQ